MELWIRSQDKRYLIKTEYLYAVYSEDSKKAYIGDKLAGHIGEYKTLERALEILDEIQKLLAPQGMMTQTKEGITFSYANIPSIVYEMPKE